MGQKQSNSYNLTDKSETAKSNTFSTLPTLQFDNIDRHNRPKIFQTTPSPASKFQNISAYFLPFIFIL